MGLECVLAAVIFFGDADPDACLDLERHRGFGLWSEAGGVRDEDRTEGEPA